MPVILIGIHLIKMSCNVIHGYRAFMDSAVKPQH
jgi:hypothetical protein